MEYVTAEIDAYDLRKQRRIALSTSAVSSHLHILHSVFVSWKCDVGRSWVVYSGPDDAVLFGSTIAALCGI